MCVTTSSLGPPHSPPRPTEIYTEDRPFCPHPGVVKLMRKRRAMLDSGKKVDWAMAETLAFATLLMEGHTVRLSGQDSERGTFAQRFAVIFDQETEASYVPLTRLGAPGLFQVNNSTLSEAAVLAYEYGASRAVGSGLQWAV